MCFWPVADSWEEMSTNGKIARSYNMNEYESVKKDLKICTILRMHIKYANRTPSGAQARNMMRNT
jgi:hypothetical protein